MAEFIGLFGRVADVKAVKSLGVCRVVIEVPIEQHRQVTNGFWDADVLVTLSDGKQGYGMAASCQPSVDSCDDERPSETDYGHYYQALYKSGFFNNPHLWGWAGSDADYQAWVREQASCVTGKRDWVDAIGEGRCEYAHVRRVAAGSGTAIKPEYFGVPLTHSEHALQHQLGELGLLQHFAKNVFTPSEAAAWFERKAVECRTAWIKAQLYEHFGVDSLKYVPPSDFVAWAKEAGLYLALPAVFKG